MELILDITNFWKPFIAVFGTWLLVQLLKAGVNYRANKPISFLQNGGQISGHAATTIALATVILLETGLSLLFLIALVIAAIVINDAVGVRQETSKHSVFLNKLTQKQDYQIVGHDAIEVLTGATFGIIIPILLYSLL